MADSLDKTTHFNPQFNDHGLIPCMVIDARDNSPLMFAWMNELALEKTRQERLAHFWSRSRQSLWLKGESSGETLSVEDMLIDCDQDVLVLKVIPQGIGAACHTGRKSCFYRSVPLGNAHMDEQARTDMLIFDPSRPLFNPEDIYD